MLVKYEIEGRRRRRNAKTFISGLQGRLRPARQLKSLSENDLQKTSLIRYPPLFKDAEKQGGDILLGI